MYKGDQYLEKHAFLPLAGLIVNQSSWKFAWISPKVDIFNPESSMPISNYQLQELYLTLQKKFS